MRGYKINNEGLIEEVYDLAPEGSKDKYDGVEGVYTETALNKLVAQNVRYREFIELKGEKRRLDVDLKDTREELKRRISEDKENRHKINSLTETLQEKQEKSEQLQKDLLSIKQDIDEVLGGVL